MYKLVLLRHGESTWNKENRFTGWTDVDLSENGREEAQAGRPAAEGGGLRVRRGLHVGAEARHPHALVVLDEMDLMWIPVHRTGGSTSATTGPAGPEQGRDRGQARRRPVKIWRRSYDMPPPALTPDDPRHPARTRATPALDPAELPLTECLKDTVARFLPYWHETIAPTVEAGERVLVPRTATACGRW